MAEFEQEIKINPRYDHAHFNMGLAKYKWGLKQEALDWWEKTLEINPFYGDAYVNMLICARELGSHQTIHETFEKSRQFNIALPPQLLAALNTPTTPEK